MTNEAEVNFFYNPKLRVRGEFTMNISRTIHAVDTHSGIPMRVVTGGIPHIPGDTVYAKMKWLEENDDGLRKLLLR